MTDVWEAMGEDGGWSPCFFRPFNDWRVEEVQRFLHAIQVKRGHPNQEDLMLSKETKDERFSVKWFDGVLDCLATVFFPHCIIWISWIPTKVGYFLLGKPSGGKC